MSKGSVLFNKLLCKIYSIICLYTSVYVYMCMYVYRYKIYGVCGVPSALRICGFLHWYIKLMLARYVAKLVNKKSANTHTHTHKKKKIRGSSNGAFSN